MRGFSAIAIVGLLIGLVGPAAAKPEKVDVCHSGDDGWVEITIPEHAAEKHVEKHGDYYKGDAPCDVMRVAFDAGGAATPDFLLDGDGVWHERDGEGEAQFYFREIERDGDRITMADITNQFRGDGFDYREGWIIELRFDLNQIWLAYPPGDPFPLYTITEVS